MLVDAVDGLNVPHNDVQYIWYEKQRVYTKKNIRIRQLLLADTENWNEEKVQN